MGTEIQLDQSNQLSQLTLRLVPFEHLCRDVTKCHGAKVVWQSGNVGKVRKMLLVARKGEVSQSRFVKSVEEAKSIANRLGVEIPEEDIIKWQ